MARKKDKQPPRTKKYYRSTKKGAGMTKKGIAKYRRDNPGSKLKGAVTGKVKKGSKAANRRKSYCARSTITVLHFYFTTVYKFVFLRHKFTVFATNFSVIIFI